MSQDKSCISLLDNAAMITGETDRDSAVSLVKEIELVEPTAQVVSARLVATAHGIYEFFVDGASIDDSVMNPGWTSYEWRLQVTETDVTELVKASDGTVRVEALLGNGWYRGKFGFERQESDYGDQIGFIGALEIVYADGSAQVVKTSAADWSAYKSPVTYNNLYNGETIDARIAKDSEALPTIEVEFDRDTMIPREGPLVMRHEVFHPQRIWTSPAGKTLIDFGQNLVGWTRFTVKGNRGDKVVVRHAEVIEDDELGARPLRQAKATDTLILSGGEDFFEPTLTFHGFRYIEVMGWPEGCDLNDIEAVEVHSAITRTGYFTCSNADVNQLVSNSVWSQRGNFLDIPSDCPQRDEREGWTGDIALFSPTATFQFDCADFLHKWLMDLKAETENAPGKFVPMVVPDVVKLKCPDNVKDWVLNPTATWGDAAVRVPRALWNAYGDKDRLADHYPAMCLHLESVEKELDERGLWKREGWQFGDWLDPIAQPEDVSYDPSGAAADKYVIAQECLFDSATFAAGAARVLGKEEDAQHWQALADRAKAAFYDEYVRDLRIKSDCTAVYSLALVFDMLDDEDKTWAAARLDELVREHEFKVTTGFASTPYIVWALSENGYVEDAYKLLLEKSCPSWLYAVSMGATTIWERWDSMLPDGKINPGGMTSFNHYAFGAVCDWIYEVVGGIRAAAPGYGRIHVEPKPGEGIDWAECALESPVGHISVSWKCVGGTFALTAEIPEGIPAEVVLPNGKVTEVTGGTHHFGCVVK